MDISTICSKILNSEEYICGWKEKRRAAVTLPLVDINGEIFLLFQVRALNLKHQPGDVCFPGGKIEGDETPVECAVRETCEELGVNSEHIQVIRELDLLVRHDNSMIHSFLIVLNVDNININKGEVDHTFYVPLDHLINYKPEVINNKIKIERGENFPFHLVRGGKNYKFREGTLKSYFYRYNEYVIWGMTAEILKSFLDKVKE